MFAILLQEEEVGTLRGRGDGRNRLLRMVMGRCTWRAAVLMVRQYQDRDDGNDNFHARACAKLRNTKCHFYLSRVLIRSNEASLNDCKFH